MTRGICPAAHSAVPSARRSRRGAAARPGRRAPSCGRARRWCARWAAGRPAKARDGERAVEAHGDRPTRSPAAFTSLRRRPRAGADAGTHQHDHAFGVGCAGYSTSEYWRPVSLRTVHPPARCRAPRRRRRCRPRGPGRRRRGSARCRAAPGRRGEAARAVCGTNDRRRSAADVSPRPSAARSC
jgi:hypothetical protein